MASQLEDDWPESFVPQVFPFMRPSSRGDTFYIGARWLCATWLCETWLCASYFSRVTLCSAQVCSAQCALRNLRCTISHASGLRKLHCSRLSRASCSLQAAARKWLDICLQTVLRTLLCASFSPQDAQRLCLCTRCSACAAHTPALRMYLKVTKFQLELRSRSPCYVCTLGLRFSRLSCGSTLRVLRLYLKTAIFQPELQQPPRTTSRT